MQRPRLNYTPNSSTQEQLEQAKNYIKNCKDYYRNEALTLVTIESLLEDIRLCSGERSDIIKNAAQIMASWIHDDDFAQYASVCVLETLVKIKLEDAREIIEQLDCCYCANEGTAAGKLAFLALGFYNGLFAINEALFDGVDLYPVALASAGGLHMDKQGNVTSNSAFSRTLHTLPSLDAFGNFANATEAFEKQVCTSSCFLAMLYTLATCGTAEQLLSDINEQSLENPAFEALVNGTVAYIRNAGFKHVKHAEIWQLADTAVQLNVKGEQYSTLMYEHIKRAAGEKFEPIDADGLI